MDHLKGSRGQVNPTGELSDAAKFRNELRGLDPDSRRCQLGQEQPMEYSQEVLWLSPAVAQPAAAVAPPVCLVTQCSVDRLSRLCCQAQAWA
eukprot:11509135-Alexandrium_andersonii.AAC.1